MAYNFGDVVCATGVEVDGLDCWMAVTNERIIWGLRLPDSVNNPFLKKSAILLPELHFHVVYVMMGWRAKTMLLGIMSYHYGLGL